MWFLQDMSGTVGPPLPCTEFKLEAVPEMKYDPGEIQQPHNLLELASPLSRVIVKSREPVSDK